MAIVVAVGEDIAQVELGMHNRDWFAEVMTEMRQYVRDGGLSELEPSLLRVYQAFAQDRANNRRPPSTLASLGGSVAQISCGSELPFPGTDLSHDFCSGRAESGEAVQDGNTNLELRDLTVEVSRHEALTQQFHTVHPIVGKTIPRIVF